LYDVSFLSFAEIPSNHLSDNVSPSQNLAHDLAPINWAPTCADIILDDRNATSLSAVSPQSRPLPAVRIYDRHMESNLDSISENPSSLASSSISDNWSNVAKWLSPLHMASSKGQTRIAKILLDHKADCNERDRNSQTPLMHAIVSGSEELVRILLLHGASIGIQDRRCRSALHYAVLHR
jgi:ankyrin repeat protein